MVCSFCPRKYDYHPLSVPAPYNHSNIDSDEILYYVAGDFMSRNDTKEGNITVRTTVEAPKEFPVSSGVVEMSGNRAVVLL